MPGSLAVRTFLFYLIAAGLSYAQSPRSNQEPDLGTEKIRFVVNQIKIDASHTAVFDYATTWANIPKGLPLTEKAEVLSGNVNGPSKLGDHLKEVVRGDTTPLLYTVAVAVPNLVWTIAGFASNTTPFVGRTVTFTTVPLHHRKTLFIRVYEEVGESNQTIATNPILQPQVIQPYLENLKALIEQQSEDHEGNGF